MGADVVVGNSQRFGVPYGLWRPPRGVLCHAAGIQAERARPRDWRLGGQQGQVGVPHGAADHGSSTSAGTRRPATFARPRVLLAVMASMYAVYHGPRRARAPLLSGSTHRLAPWPMQGGLQLDMPPRTRPLLRYCGLCDGGCRCAVMERAGRKRHQPALFPGRGSRGRRVSRVHLARGLPGRYAKSLGFSAVTLPDMAGLRLPVGRAVEGGGLSEPPGVQHLPVSETAMMRYSEAAGKQGPVLDPRHDPSGVVYHEAQCGDAIVAHWLGAFAQLHPFCPPEQAKGTRRWWRNWSSTLSEITGFAGMSLQPNSGAQGEYTRTSGHPSLPRVAGRSPPNVCLIPSSAHGTNPASAVMCGMEGGGGGVRQARQHQPR